MSKPNTPSGAEQARGGFFDVDSEDQKIDKNRALEPQGPKKSLRPVVGWCARWLAGPGWRTIIKEFEVKKQQGLRSRS